MSTTIYFLRINMFFLCLPMVAAQDYSMNDFYKNALRISTGFHTIKVQDILYSPMIYRGSSIANLRLQYDLHSRNGLHQFAAAYEQMGLTGPIFIQSPEFERQSADILFAVVSYSYLHSLKSTDNTSISIGGRLATHFHNTTYPFGFGGEEGYLFVNELGLKMRGDYLLKGKYLVTTQLVIPVLSLVARPEYALVDNQDIQGADGIGYLYERSSIASFTDYRSITVKISFDVKLTNHLLAGLGYQGNILRVDTPEPITTIKNYVDLSLAFQF